MKRLYLIRHAKSDWGAEAGSDHERPLAPRGRRAARRVGRFLSALGQVPDLVVSSSAVRALTTAELAAEAGDWGVSIESSRDLYEASPMTLLKRIQSVPDEVASALLVGHEPVWSETVRQLVGGAELRMVTAALARIDLPADRWQDVEFGSGVLIWMVTPKLLAAADA